MNSIAFSLDGKVLASGSNDQTIRFWEVRTGKELRRCAGNPGQVCAIHFSTDGRTLVSASYDAGIRLWGADTGKELRQLGHPQGRVHDVALSQDGTALAAANGDDLSASLWEVASGKMLRHFKNGRREFSRALTRISLAGLTVESVVAADENMDALYEYLIGGER